MEQAAGLRELHPSFTQHTLVRSVPEMKTVVISSHWQIRYLSFCESLCLIDAFLQGMKGEVAERC